MTLEESNLYNWTLYTVADVYDITILSLPVPLYMAGN